MDKISPEYRLATVYALHRTSHRRILQINPLERSDFHKLSIINSRSSIFTIQVESLDQGKRLDAMVAAHLSDLSRSLAAMHIRSGAVQVNEALRKPGYRVKPGDLIHGAIPPPEPMDW